MISDKAVDAILYKEILLNSQSITLDLLYLCVYFNKIDRQIIQVHYVVRASML